MKNSEKVMKDFRTKIRKNKFQKETYPNPPPYFDGDYEKTIEDYQKFLEFDYGKLIMNL